MGIWDLLFNSDDENNDDTWDTELQDVIAEREGIEVIRNEKGTEDSVDKWHEAENN